MSAVSEIDNNEIKQSFTILFVDDEENILRSLRRLFRQEDYQILAALSGKEGLELLATQDIDLIISDMRMPEMDGAEFLEKAATQWPDTIRILLTGFSDIKSTVAAINQGKILRYIQKPWEDNDIKFTVAQALKQKQLERERDALQALTRRQNAELQNLNSNLELKVEQRTAQLQQTMLKLEKTHESLKKSYIASVQVFSSLMEMREGILAGHSRKVANHSRKIALKMGLKKEECQTIMIAGLLHDIGKIGLSDSILKVPYSELNGEDLRRFKKHSVEGQAALMALEPLEGATVLIRHHHEQYDGLGYPDGLKGKEIPIGARILAVANDYEALLSGSLVSNSQSKEQAIEFLRRNRSKRYDSKVVDVFLDLIGFRGRVQGDAKCVQISSHMLRPGMVVAKDTFSKSGILLLVEGHVITKSIIDRIENYERSLSEKLSVYIYIDGEC